MPYFLIKLIEKMFDICNTIMYNINMEYYRNTRKE